MTLVTGCFEMETKYLEALYGGTERIRRNVGAWLCFKSGVVIFRNSFAADHIRLAIVPRRTIARPLTHAIRSI